MWLELSVGWINTEHLVRVEFATEESKLKATLITVKPGGSDRTFVYEDDARKLQAMLESTREKPAKKQKAN